jgi:ABC-type sugar transport system ATPase subunit
MNILRCRVLREKPLLAEWGGADLTVPAVVPAGTREVLIGIRPEDAQVTAAQQKSARPVTVSVIEPAGPVNRVDVEWEGGKLTCMSQPDEELRPGGTAYVTLSPEKLSAFDAATGGRLPEGPP